MSTVVREPASRQATRPAERGGADLAERARLGLAEYLRHVTRHGAAGTISEERGVLLVAGSHTHQDPFRNAVLRFGGELPGEAVLERARAFFGQRGRGYVVWAREDEDADLIAAARRAGLRPLEPGGLSLDLLVELPPSPAPPEHVVVEASWDAARRSDFAALAGADGMLLDPRSLAAPNVAGCVAYLDGRPAAGGMAFVSHGLALAFQTAADWADEPAIAETALRPALEVAFRKLGALGSAVLSTADTTGSSATRYWRFAAHPGGPRWE